MPFCNLFIGQPSYR